MLRYIRPILCMDVWGGRVPSHGRKTLGLFNLIISHEPGRFEQREALEIVREVLKNARIFDTPPPLILVKVDNPYIAVEKLSKSLDESSPILRIIPLDALTSSLLEDVVEVAVEVAKKKLSSDDTFAIRIEGNIYQRDERGIPIRLHKIDVIKAIAAHITNKVNLDNPDKVVLVKSIRISRSLRYAGIMVDRPTAIYTKHGKRWRGS